MYEEEEKEKTNTITLYEKGTDYLKSKNFYEQADQNERFYKGDQWHDCDTGTMPKITYNIIKPIVRYKLNVVTANEYGIVYTPNNFKEIEFQKNAVKVCEFLNHYIATCWKEQMKDFKNRKIAKKSCINGEGISYSYWDDVNETIASEVINTTNVIYSNENNSDIEEQDYIIVRKRVNIAKLKEEAEKEGISNNDLKKIVPDTEYLDELGDSAKKEVENDTKCNVYIKFYKKEGEVYWSKSTKYLDIVKDEPLGMNLYPLNHFVWEEEEGSARGVGEVQYKIENQKEINKTAMRRAIAVMLGAYPKMAYITDKIKNIQALTEIGAAIAVESGVNINDVITYLKPQQISPDSTILQNELMNNTRELDGAGNTATGQIDPENASGKAILAVKDANAQNLNDQMQSYKQFIEREARIWYEIIKANCNSVITLYREIEKNGETTYESLDIRKETLEKMKIGIKIDVTPLNPYSNYALELALENLYLKGEITIDEYAEALPDASQVKAKIIKILQNRKKNKEEVRKIEEQVNVQEQELANALANTQKQEQIDAIYEQVNSELGGVV